SRFSKCLNLNRSSGSGFREKCPEPEPNRTFPPLPCPAAVSYPVPGMETDGLDADGIAGTGTGLRRESLKCRRCGLSCEHYGA
ncbi:hypothetical protein B0H12DRAFT_1139216, partial [Mycena haematopus]